MAVARDDNNGIGKVRAVVPEVLEISAADFEQVCEWRLNPPTPTLAAVAANKMFYRLLRSSSASS